MIGQIDERLNAENREQLRGGMTVQGTTGLARGNGALKQTSIAAPALERLESGNATVGLPSGSAINQQVQTFPSEEQNPPMHPPIRHPYTEAAFGPSNIGSSSQASPVIMTASRNSPATIESPQLAGPKSSNPTPSATASPVTGVAKSRPLQHNGFMSPKDFSALAGAVIPTAQQVEDNRRRRSSDAQSRRSSGTYPRRESGLGSALLPVPQGVALSGYENRPRWCSVQPHTAAYASTPNIQSSGYRIPSVSPLLSSAVSFASGSPLTGAVISPTVSTSGRFASPASSAGPPGEGVLMPQADSVDVAAAKVTVAKEVQAIDVLNPHTGQDGMHARPTISTNQESSSVISPMSPTATESATVIPYPIPEASEPAPVIPLISFEFKPPAKPIPSLPDWLSGNTAKEKRKEERAPLPDWAGSNAVRIGDHKASVPASSKRRRTETASLLWYDDNGETSKSAGEIIDLTEDSLPIRSSPPRKSAQAFETTSESQRDNPVEGTDIDFEAIASKGGILSADSARPSDPQSMILCDTNDTPSVHSDIEPMSPAASRPAISLLIEEAEAVAERIAKRPKIQSTTKTSTELRNVYADVEMQDLSDKRDEGVRSKAPTMSLLLNNDVELANGKTPMYERSPNESAAVTLPTKTGPAVSSSTHDLFNSRENSSRNARASSVVSDAPHQIPDELAMEDIIRWQRKVWRACFCDWSRCGAALDNWEALEKVVPLVRRRSYRNTDTAWFIAARWLGSRQASTAATETETRHSRSKSSHNCQPASKQFASACYVQQLWRNERKTLI